MRTTKKILSTVLATAFVSGALAGSAFARDPDETVGDLNGDRPMTIRQQRVANEKALRDARTLRIIEGKWDLTNQYRIPFEQEKGRNANATQPGPLLPFKGDWNGTAKAGFPHQ